MYKRQPLFTTLAGARAACTGMDAAHELRAYSVQQLHQQLAAADRQLATAL